jgi:hypothetical protein
MTGRKIYNKVVIDMETDEVLEEDSFFYSGPLALCDGEEDFSDFDGNEGGEEGEPEGEELEGEESEELGESEEEEAEADPTKLQQQVQQLQAQLEELTELSSSKDESTKQEGPPEYEPQQFVKSDDDLDGVLNSAEGLNNALNSAVQTAIQHVYKGMPGVIKNNVAQQIQLQETVSNFYSNNEDLKKHRGFVGKVSERIMSENPNWSMQKVLDETAKEARKRLGLKQKAEGKAKKKDPGFAKGGKGGKKGKQSNLSGQEKQIADMLSVTDT